MIITAAAAPPSFLDWLAHAHISDDPIGDLIADLQRDRRTPASISSCAALRRYLRSRRACRAALHAAPKVWHQYRRARTC
jgi:hypothetical protein